jgi:hypothetical protein
LFSRISRIADFLAWSPFVVSIRSSKVSTLLITRFFPTSICLLPDFAITIPFSEIFDGLCSNDPSFGK